MKAILNKLWGNNKRSTSVKAELREVKLSLANDLQDNFNSLEILNENWINKWTETNNLIDDLINEAKTIFEEGQVVQDQLDELVNSLNEIGLEPGDVIENIIVANENFIVNKNDLQQYANDLKSKIDNI